MNHYIRNSCQTAILVIAGWLVVATEVPGAEAGGQAASLTGNVVKVFDGDSLVVQTRSGNVEVRLADVDAPEKGQPYADNARKALIGLINGREIQVEVLDVDQYRRKVARVHRAVDGLDINAEVVRRGHAWVYRRYVRDQSLFDLEQAAKNKRLGLWAQAEELRIPPWRYRALQRATKQEEP